MKPRLLSCLSSHSIQGPCREKDTTKSGHLHMAPSEVGATSLCEICLLQSLELSFGRDHSFTQLPERHLAASCPTVAHREVTGIAGHFLASVLILETALTLFLRNSEV